MMTKTLVGWLLRCPVGDNIMVHPTTLAAIEETGRVVRVDSCEPQPQPLGVPTLGGKPLRKALHVPANEIWFCGGLTPRLIILYKDNAK